VSVLVVDDDLALRGFFETLLSRKGFSVDCASDGRIAYDQLSRHNYSVILLDLMMPNVDGFVILESLRGGEGIETFLPVVVLTADVNDETKRRALTTGATDFLVKPFDQTEVLLRIRNLLETRRVHLLLDNQRFALEDAVWERTSGLRTAISELQRSHRVIGTLLAETLHPLRGDSASNANLPAREDRR